MKTKIEPKENNYDPLNPFGQMPPKRIIYGKDRNEYEQMKKKADKLIEAFDRIDYWNSIFRRK